MNAVGTVPGIGLGGQPNLHAAHQQGATSPGVTSLAEAFGGMRLIRGIAQGARPVAHVALPPVGRRRARLSGPGPAGHGDQGQRQEHGLHVGAAGVTGGKFTVSPAALIFTDLAAPGDQKGWRQSAPFRPVKSKSFSRGRADHLRKPC